MLYLIAIVDLNVSGTALINNTSVHRRIVKCQCWIILENWLVKFFINYFVRNKWIDAYSDLVFAYSVTAVVLTMDVFRCTVEFAWK